MQEDLQDLGVNKRFWALIGLLKKTLRQDNSIFLLYHCYEGKLNLLNDVGCFYPC